MQAQDYRCCRSYLEEIGLKNMCWVTDLSRLEQLSVTAHHGHRLDIHVSPLLILSLHMT